MGETTIFSCRINSCVLIVFFFFVFAKFFMPTLKISRIYPRKPRKSVRTTNITTPPSQPPAKCEGLPAELREASLDNIFFLFLHKFHVWMEINVKNRAHCSVELFLDFNWKTNQNHHHQQSQQRGLVFGCNNRLHCFHLLPPLNHHHHYPSIIIGDTKETKKKRYWYF